LAGKPDGKRLKHRGEDNIKLYLKQNGRTGRHGLDYLAVCKDKWWAIARNGNESSGSIKCGKFVR